MGGGQPLGQLSRTVHTGYNPTRYPGAAHTSGGLSPRVPTRYIPTVSTGKGEAGCMAKRVSGSGLRVAPPPY